MRRSEYQQKIENHLRSAYLLSDDKIEEVLPRFIANLKSLMNDLEKYSNSENIEALNRTGHTMKGALLNLGLMQLADIAFSIEKFDALQDNKTDLAKRITELKNELGKIN